ncbi:DUF6188 family protein [Nocardia crassostreae]|uniref:DUF6188 family protein n=1 Tax=Nocardia crassostreae TaxID=53428 RepID=UPI0008331F46|nr:DUF6188 family protein [Nocardia crassostreae]
MKLPLAGERLCVLSTEPLLAIGIGVYELHVGSELTIETPNGVVHHVVGDPTRTHDNLVGALDGTIESATVNDKGGLRIVLDSGAHVVVDPDRYYEAWTFTGPRSMIASMPGGELAVWQDES